jgi:tyrosyl-tRNA synthetase
LKEQNVTAKDAFEEFRWRGLVFDHTEAVPELLAKEKISVYNGFDPTADSLHIGNLVAMMGLARLQRFGHTPIVMRCLWLEIWRSWQRP